MRRQTILSSYQLYLRALFLGLFIIAAPLMAQPWQNLALGIDYIDLKDQGLTPWSHIHVFRIDLTSNQLNVVMAKQLSQTHASVRTLALHANAYLAINGGFFDKKYQPLGLRINQQEEWNPIKPISWWGIFYIQHQIPVIQSLYQYKTLDHIDFAVQSGPRLLSKGQLVNSLKPGLAERSAIGITRDNHVIMLVTNNAPMTTIALANLMKSPPLHCVDALNLDGGSSSQLYAQIDDFKRHVPGYSEVSDAIVVKPRLALTTPASAKQSKPSMGTSLM